MSRPVAIVTGGAGGIGGAINARLEETGWQIVAGDLAPALAATPPVGEHLTAAEVDVSDRASVAAFVETAAAVGPIGALVNCAGVVRFTPVAGFDDAAASLVWEVNVAGAARMTEAAAPHLADAGAVVNISSVTGHLGRLQGASLYGSSKAGLEGLTRYLSNELADRGIRVNAIAPGYINVPMSESWRAISGGEEALIPQVPLRRLGEPKEIADAVEFLVSERSSYITGTTLLVDGGLVGR